MQRVSNLSQQKTCRQYPARYLRSETSKSCVRGLCINCRDLLLTEVPSTAASNAGLAGTLDALGVS